MSFEAPERRVCDGFVLRSYFPGDGPALNEATLASYDHLRPWMSWATNTQTLDDSASLVRQFRAKFLTNDDFVLGAWSSDETTLLGGTGFHLRGAALETAQPEVGMWVRADHAGRGLGTRMLREMLLWAFSDWPWLRIEWRCDSRNVGSRRVAEKCGLRLEGTLRAMYDDVSRTRRDTCLYAILRDD